MTFIAVIWFIWLDFSFVFLLCIMLTTPFWTNITTNALLPVWNFVICLALLWVCLVCAYFFYFIKCLFCCMLIMYMSQIWPFESLVGDKYRSFFSFVFPLHKLGIIISFVPVIACIPHFNDFLFSQTNLEFLFAFLCLFQILLLNTFWCTFPCEVFSVTPHESLLHMFFVKLFRFEHAH